MVKWLVIIVLSCGLLGGAYLLGKSHSETEIIKEIVYKEKEDAKKVEDIHKEVITMPDADKRDWLRKNYLIAE